VVSVTPCIGPPSVLATTVYWDTNGPGVGSGGPSPNGLWSNSASNWSTDPVGSLPTNVWQANDTAVFSAGFDSTGAYNVTVDGNQSASGLRFEEGNATLNGLGQLILTGAADVHVEPGVASGNISAALSGTAGLFKSGPGPLTLVGTQGYSGETTVNE